ncbi:MAG: sulfatase-like hydrolase/transferase [Tannerellaceae bacterium]|nr:sulfatase-like hydrolase/transferase [Tannerellaceae bacterium]
MKNILIQGGLFCSAALAAQQAPNIIWILADDMRASTLELFNEEQCRTPHLNQLAEDCTVFRNAHIMGGSSGAVSMPSRAMLMTGAYLYKLEEQGAKIPETQVTIGETLRKAGYETFHIGKWHSEKAAFNRCFSNGKDIFFGGMADHWNVPLYNYDPTGRYEPSRRVIGEPLRNNEVEMKAGEYMYSGKHSVDIFTDSALDFLQHQQYADKPFFLSLCYMSPHEPRSMKDEFMNMYNPDDIVLPPNFMNEHPLDNGELIIRDESLAAYPRQEKEIRKHIAEYYGMITHLDYRIGQLITKLKETGLYENTILVFMADNGLGVGQHGLMGKQNLYRHSVNVPLLIKGVGDSPSHRFTEQLCYLIDIYPTVCEMAGMDVPGSVDGISLVPVLTEDKVVRPSIYLGYRHLQRGIIQGDWKYMEYHVKGECVTQLFNIKDDPYETNNLGPDKKQAKRIRTLRGEMLKHRDITGDTTAFWELQD